MNGNVEVRGGLNNTCQGNLLSHKATINLKPAVLAVSPPSGYGGSTYGNSSPVTFTTQAISCATGYTWSFPSGWTGSSSTNSITLHPSGCSSDDAGNITVTANMGNCSLTASLYVSYSIPNNIYALGPDNICSTGGDYNFWNVPQTISATWSVTPSNYFVTSSGSGRSAHLVPVNSSVSGVAIITSFMKTCVNVLLLIIICCLKSPGQQSTNIDAPHPKKFISQIEIFTGPSAVGVHDNSAYSKYGTLKIGFQAGVGLSHSISRSVDCNLKFYFERKGFRQETEAFFPPDIYNSPPTSNLPPVSTQVIGDLNIDYVSASISPRYFFGKKKYGYIDIGIYGSQLIKSQITVTETQNGQLKRKTLLNQDGTYKDYDLGLSLSLGYAFRFLKKLTLGPKLLWNYGMIDIVNLQPGLTSMKNNSVVFLVNANF